VKAVESFFFNRLFPFLAETRGACSEFIEGSPWGRMVGANYISGLGQTLTMGYFETETRKKPVDVLTTIETVEKVQLLPFIEIRTSSNQVLTRPKIIVLGFFDSLICKLYFIGISGSGTKS